MPDAQNSARQIIDSRSDVTDVQLIAPHDRGGILSELAADGHAEAGGTIDLQRRTEHRQRGIARDGQGVDRQGRL